VGVSIRVNNSGDEIGSLLYETLEVGVIIDTV